MKNHKLHLLSCLLFGLLALSCEENEGEEQNPTSETVITKADYQAAMGDVTAYHVDVSSADLDPGPPGAGVTWDFSEYDDPVVTTFTEAFQCPGEEACSEFPDANRIAVAHGEGGGYSYSLLSDKELSRIGAKGTDGIITTYSDPEVIWEFPIEYQKEFSDSYHQSSTSGQAITGEKTIVADGYGTLKTAAGTFPNTIRLKITRNLVLTSPFGGHSSSVVTYTWLNKQYKGGLLLQVLFSETTVQGDTKPTGFGKSLIYTKPEPL